MTGIEWIDVTVIERRDGSKQLAAQNWGWPSHNETVKGHDTFVNTMEQLSSEIDVSEAEPGEVVAKLEVHRPSGVIDSVDHCTGSH